MRPAQIRESIPRVRAVRKAVLCNIDVGFWLDGLAPDPFGALGFEVSLNPELLKPYYKALEVSVPL